MPPFEPVQEPFVSLAPIAPGAGGFYQRGEIFIEIQKLLRAGDSVSLVGERKAGKTSFLNYLSINLPADEFIPVYIDLQFLVGATDQNLLGWLAWKAAQAIARTKSIEEAYAALEADEAADNPVRAFLDNLLLLLNQHFGLDDLQTLCFKLGVDYDNLPAAGEENRASQLMILLQRQDLLSVLVTMLRSLRPEVKWQDVPAPIKNIQADEPLKTNTLEAAPNMEYLTFAQDLEKLRNELPLGSSGQKRRLVWLIDEIEILQGYKDTSLFQFLRPIAIGDPQFRFVVAGYDVLYALSSESPWSPFYNAFRHQRLRGLSPDVARRMVDDALLMMGAEIDPDQYLDILEWTGRKPYFLKWMMYEIARSLNEGKSNYNVNKERVERAKALFLSEKDIELVVMHQHDKHATDRQQLVLAYLAAHPEVNEQLQMLNGLKAGKKWSHTSGELNDDLTRLEQLGFLYENDDLYTFTSEYLRQWIAKNKPF